MKLDVHVRGKRVAKLFRERDNYVLKYTAAATAADFISLAMPVREAPWEWPRDLHPFFRQNLPEGYVLNVIREEFGSLLDGTDLSLLALVGSMGIGRVAVTPEDVKPGSELKPVDLESLLTGETPQAHFTELVRQYARAAISGAIPKFLAPELDADPVMETGKTSFRTSRHIIKGSDDNTPCLGFNEFYAMRVLERLDVVPVAQCRMSSDGRLLVVDRFDVDAQGLPTHGLEDACSLLGLPPHEKYATTLERVVHATAAYLPAARQHAAFTHLGWHILTNFVVRNAACHSKNIALYYTSRDDVNFTPVFDIVTTQAYPRYANNPPGLSIEGRRTWAPGKSVEHFFKARLQISPREYAEMVTRLCDSAVDVGHEMIAAAKREPRCRQIAKQMLHAWNDGMAELRGEPRDSKSRGLTSAIDAAGFSDVLPPEPPQSVGRSELLAKPKRRVRSASKRAPARSPRKAKRR